MYFGSTVPSLSGISYTTITAEEDIVMWSDRDYKITKLPAFLKGSTSFRVKIKAHPKGTTISIITRQPSTLYVAFELGQGRDGGFDTSLPSNGWTLVAGSVETTCCSLNRILTKSLEIGETTILPATTTNQLVHAIFVAKSKSPMYCLLCL